MNYLVPLLSFFVLGCFISVECDPVNYYTGDYKISLNLYSFNVNILAWIHNRRPAPPVTTFEAITWAKKMGFDSVNIPMYYIIGYSGDSMPTNTTKGIKDFVAEVKAHAEEEGIEISGTGIGNDFANSDPDLVKLDIDRALFWIDRASEMGAPFMRVFSGFVPDDLDKSGGWEEVSKNRVVPALQEVTVYAASKGVKIGLQNHGDMTATADQTIQMLKWVNHPNIGIVDDTGYFRPFRADTGLDYDWYTDINNVLPYSLDFQTKLKPAGADQKVRMDFIKLFTGLRMSTYHEDVNLERLWFKDDPDNPKDQPTPPYDEVEEFLGQVKEALEETKNGPIDF